jgi:hypothetical protein
MHPVRTVRDLATRHARVTSVAGVAALALASGGVAFAATRGSDHGAGAAAISRPADPPAPTSAPTVTTPTTAPTTTAPPATTAVPTTAGPTSVLPPTTAPTTVVTVPPTTTTTRPTPRTIIRTRELGLVLRGTVTGVDGGRWTVTTDGGVAVTVLVTPRTAFGPKVAPTTAEAFPPGTAVVVFGSRLDGIVTAGRIRTPPAPRPRRPPSSTPDTTTTVAPAPTTTAPTTAPADMTTTGSTTAP